MTASGGKAPGLVVLRIEKVHGLVTERHLELLAVDAEDLLVRVTIRAADLHLVLNAAEERLVHEIAGIQVRGEDQNAVEGHRELDSRVERQVVEALLQRDDPPVEELSRTHALPTEVVDDQDATGCLQLERGLIHLRVRVVLQIELIEGELATHENRGAFDLHETLVVGGPASEETRRGSGLRILFPLDLLVIDRVVEDHHAPVDQHGLREEHRARGQRADALGGCGLSVAWGSVQEDRPARVHRGPEGLDDARGKNQVRERTRQVFLANVDVPHALRRDGASEDFERHRRRAHVAAGIERCLRAGAALTRERERVTAAAVSERLQNLDEVPMLSGEDEVVDQRKWKRDDLGDFLAEKRAVTVQDLEYEVRHLRPGESRLFQGVRDGGYELLVPRWSGLLRHRRGDHCFGRRTARIHLPFGRGG
jgi:hypothetical protein